MRQSVDALGVTGRDASGLTIGSQGFECVGACRGVRYVHTAGRIVGHPENSPSESSPEDSSSQVPLTTPR